MCVAWHFILFHNAWTLIYEQNIKDENADWKTNWGNQYQAECTAVKALQTRSSPEEKHGRLSLTVNYVDNKPKDYIENQ